MTTTVDMVAMEAVMEVMVDMGVTEDMVEVDMDMVVMAAMEVDMGVMEEVRISCAS
uniref:Heterogeneous nuclear ribonucleoprotein D-like n=1 Tax=Phallusia mammillata TaxID=59560 RepID=A0A6F9DF56_9ASCI|nr:heterogeneous nuclear ribonucleoprotein D-like [Phallusia mammillata]